MKKAVPQDDGVAQMRPGIRSILEAAFGSAVALREIAGPVGSAYCSPDNIGKFASAVEHTLFASTAKSLNRKYDYSIAVKHMTALLRQPFGVHPDEVGALKILRGELAISDALQTPLAPEEKPRDITCRMLVATLMRASEVYANDRERVVADARSIELSCFNNIVRTSKRLPDPPRRQWDSPVFRDMYSARCGKINILLDPTSTACVQYGTTVVARLLSGELLPSELGDASAQTLCPAATKAERDEIAARAAQKVPEKHSNLFECPRCRVRECVYKEIHTRGPDEAPDYFCRCVCGFHFKGRS